MARASTPSVLTALGFPAQVDRMYQRLLSQSGRDLARVAASVLRTPEELLDDLAPLLEAGIVRREGRAGEVLVIDPPVEAVRRMVAAQSVEAARTHRRLGGIAEAIGRLAEDAASTATAGEPSRPLEGEVVTGGDLYPKVRSIVLRGRGDLLWLRPDQWREPREARMTELVAGALRGTGRRSRGIYPVRALHDAPEVLEARAAVGEEIRVLPELSTRLLVVGGSCVMLPEPLGYADAPLTVVRQGAILEAITQWFELLWEHAAVPSRSPDEPRVDLRRFLLEQLAAGAHDEQIARKLGISLRTVRRRVAGLMSELGADSRFQAGAEAVRRGWL